MKTEIKFKACKHLDFSDSYSAKKELISSKDGTKVCWNRPVIDNTYPSLVQFCKLRGRLNSPTACLCHKDKVCNEFENIEHKVEINLNEK